MLILALEPYYGGSHRAFLDGLIGCSRHDFELLTLPARKWKWRMRGSAIWFARQASGFRDQAFDLILANDMVSVADWRALCPMPMRSIPVVCYFHENQISYPLQNEADRDFQYGFTNITTCLASDSIWFNSAYHLDEFCEGAEQLLGKMPDHVPQGVVDEILAKSNVMHPGIKPTDMESSDPPVQLGRRPKSILWNHRWEYDKNPEAFFASMIKLHRAGIEFDLYVAGERFRAEPAIFEEAKRVLAQHIRHWGFVTDRVDYQRILSQCDLVVSTAIHEFFGLSVLEAVSAGCQAILPDRLSYPELFHDVDPQVAAFYRKDSDLADLLTERIGAETRSFPHRQHARLFAEKYSWPQRAGDFDAAFEAAANA